MRSLKKRLGKEGAKKVVKALESVISEATGPQVEGVKEGDS